MTPPLRPHVGESDLQKLNFNATFRPRLENQDAGEEGFVPCIDDYRLTDHGRVEFRVRWTEDPANDEWLQEGEMNVSSIPKLFSMSSHFQPEMIRIQLLEYRNNVSGVHYDYDDNYSEFHWELSKQMFLPSILPSRRDPPPPIRRRWNHCVLCLVGRRVDASSLAQRNFRGRGQREVEWDVRRLQRKAPAVTTFNYHSSVFMPRI